MLAANGPRWNDRGAGPHWSSLGVSIAITTSAFLAALASMTPIPRWIASRTIDSDPPTAVRLEPPPVELPRKPKPDVRPTPRVSAPAPIAVPAAPRVIPSTIPIAPPVVAPIAAPTSTTAPRDSSPGPRSGSVIPMRPVRPSITFPDNGVVLGHFGAPIAPAGVTASGRAPNTPQVRDSIAANRMDEIPLLAKTHAPRASELAELQQSQRTADRLARRATTAGNSRDVHVMMGEGVDGVGAVNGGRTSFSPFGGSIPFPLFSSGPSPAQRKANEKLDAEYQLRLRRLQDRARLVADAVHLDSLRLDSLRHDSLTRSSRRPIP